MKRVRFLVPRGGVSRHIVEAALGLVGYELAGDAHTELELLIAYDWAMREHLHASDNPRIRRRAAPLRLVESKQTSIQWPEHQWPFEADDR